MNRIRIASFVLASLLLSGVPFAGVAQEDTVESGVGTLTILQEGVSKESLGNWTLIRPDGTHLELDKHGEYSNDNAMTGKYTLLIEKPKGTSVSVSVFQNGTLISEITTPSATFVLSNEETVLVTINWAFNQVGTVSVSTDPPGVPFVLTGPNGEKYTGETPASYDNVPEGLYSVKLTTIEECTSPPAQSDKLIEGSRVSFAIRLSCDAMEEVRQEDYQKTLQFVTMLREGKTIVLNDVPMNTWFANFVHSAAKTGVMTGYKDSEGNYTGKFGPADTVNLAQLVKVAHVLAGIDEDDARQHQSKNTRARNSWFEQYWASAEEQSWWVFRDERIDPSRPATRAEVVATLLQALDIPRLWARGDFFVDVHPTTRYAASIETAASDGIVTGSVSAVNSSLIAFRPDEPVNRAELAKIIAAAMEVYIEDSPEITGE